MKSNMHGPVLRWLAASLLAISMLAGCGGGSSDPAVTAPQADILFGGAVSSAVAGADATGSMGAPIELDAGASRDVDGSALTFSWSIVSKPSGSSLSLANAGASKLVFQADAMGSYVFKLRVSNSKGGFAEKNATVLVNNTVPNSVVVVNTTFAADSLVKPAMPVSIGSGIVLDASNSKDPDGDIVTSTWTLIDKPAASKAALVLGDNSARFVADLGGVYKVRVRGTDDKGAYAETVYVFEAANRSPYNVILNTVAVIDRSTQTAIAGALVSASGALSYDEHGAALSYLWTLESRPATSAAVIASTATPQLAFIPDVAGAYVLSLKVSNGTLSNTAYMSVNALTSTPTIVPLDFKPAYAKYSVSLDRVIAIASNPDALKIVHPVTGVIKSVIMPAASKAMSLSANGKLAAVLHEGAVTLVDLEAAQVIRTMATGGAHTEVALRNDGIAYFTGQTGGQWVRPAVVVLNLLTGNALKPLDFAQQYGVTHGVFAASRNKVLTISDGLNPADILYVTVDPVSGDVLTNGDSPYHGDYPMSGPLFLSASEQLVFTASGTYFNVDNLTYAGTLGLKGQVHSLSHSEVRGEALVMMKQYDYSSYPYPVSYQASYQRFSIAGPVLAFDQNIALPAISGQPSYGVGIFHSNNGSHVALVQTGSALVDAAGVKYYVLYR